jgi:hypothetical protein
MHKSLASALLAVMLAVPTASSQAQQGDLLGSRSVADNSESDTISVPGSGRYGAIRLCVAQRTVHFGDLDIRFGNGGSQDAGVREVINPGECTRWISLNGPRRNITAIVMRYQTVINVGGQAVVSAYGR